MGGSWIKVQVKERWGSEHYIIVYIVQVNAHTRGTHMYIAHCAVVQSLTLWTRNNNTHFEDIEREFVLAQFTAIGCSVVELALKTDN